MGNRVFLDIRFTHRTDLIEEDAEDVVRLSSNNGLPLFWLSLLKPDIFAGEWDNAVRQCYVHEADEPDPAYFIPDIDLSWDEASRNMQAIAKRIKQDTETWTDVSIDPQTGVATTLDWRSLYLRWAAGLNAIAPKLTAKYIVITLNEYAHFYDTADDFIAAVKDAAAFWQGNLQNLPFHIDDPARDLTGFDDKTDLPFPHQVTITTRPANQPSTPAQSNLQEWLIVGLVLLICGLGWILGRSLLGAVGGWIGLITGLIISVKGVWTWAKHQP